MRQGKLSISDVCLLALTTPNTLGEVDIYKCWATANSEGHKALRFYREHIGIHHKDPFPDPKQM